MSKTNKPLLAYHVGEGSEGEQVIVFATSSAAGRRKGGRGMEAQHARDSAELRRLCSERDEQWRIRRDVEADRDTANAISAELRAERDALRQQRDKLAGLLREVKSAYTTAIHWEDMQTAMAQIKTALSELTP